MSDKDKLKKLTEIKNKIVEMIESSNKVLSDLNASDGIFCSIVLKNKLDEDKTDCIYSLKVFKKYKIK